MQTYGENRIVSNSSSASSSAEAAADANLEMGFVDDSSASKPLTRQQVDAAKNCVASSRHSTISLLPNCSLNKEHQELQGFLFECNLDDSASILPITKSSFAQTTIYQCFAAGQNFDAIDAHSLPYLQLVSDFSSTCAKMKEFVQEIEESTGDPLTLDCMPDYEDASMNDEKNGYRMWQDNKVWTENIPNKIGLYHCFMRTNAQTAREHQVYIIVSGECKFASEQLYNYWLDARNHITARQFVNCAELNWLRQATARNHNRLAAKLAKKMNLHVRLVKDGAAADSTVNMALPANQTVYCDICHDTQNNKLYVTSEAVLLKNAKSGILCDYSLEGFWCYHGPNDHQTYKTFGSNLSYDSKKPAFPCSTIKYHSLFQPKSKANVIAYNNGNATGKQEHQSEAVMYATKDRKYTGFLFPNQNFLDLLTPLGLDRTNLITCLMPICVYITDE